MAAQAPPLQYTTDLVICVTELPHNTAAHLAVPFPPVISCRFFDLPPVNLQNLQERLTKIFTRQLTTSLYQRFLKQHVGNVGMMYGGTPGMGNSLVVKVHYTLGSRKC